MWELNGDLLKDIEYINDSKLNVINGSDVKIYDFTILRLIEVAQKATCKRSKCGSVITLNWADSNHQTIVSTGFNSMPCNEVGECFKGDLPSTFKSDKTCCIHAEQRAIINMLKMHGNQYVNDETTLFFLRLDDEGKPKHSGDPYCSICSKMALDVGITKFGLWREHGWDLYNTKEYNDLTFQYSKS